LVVLFIAILLFCFFQIALCGEHNYNKKSIEALYNQGIAYRVGIGVNQDVHRAAALFLKAAKRSHAGAQYELGHMYKQGLGVTKDINKAIKWLSKSANNNHVRAQYSLAYIFESGDEVEQNYNKALSLYNMAAEQGDFLALYRLGKLYEMGKGVKRDYSKALLYYKKSANKDYVNAQYAIGMLYKSGKGVDENLVISQKWFIIAYERWRDLKSFLEMEKLKMKLSSEEQAMAKALSEEWLNENKPPKGVPGGR
jgi:TPR repeat protein